MERIVGDDRNEVVFGGEREQVNDPVEGQASDLSI